MLAATRRFVTLLAGIAGVTALGSLVLGLLLGARTNRSLAVGFYLVGCALLLGGFFTANRGPFRVASEEGMVGLRRPRGVRVVSSRTGARLPAAQVVLVDVDAGFEIEPVAPGSWNLKGARSTSVQMMCWPSAAISKRPPRGWSP